MTPQEFVAKWKRADLSERSACQQHFLDLCDLLAQPKPAAADPHGTWYTFERGVKKTSGGKGWADVWLRGHFGWEYKGKHKDLAEAYRQLLLYREDLENPPLLIVCDLDRFEIHTNFTRTAKHVYRFNLDGLSDPKNLDVLRKAFTNPDALRPGQTAEAITKQAAEQFGQLADRLRVRGIPAERAAHFLMKIIFCMFAEDIRLLPDALFSRLLDSGKREATRLPKLLEGLFTAMATGGDFGVDPILHFNGGLFDDADVIDLTADEVESLICLNDFDWSDVEPSIFGTLFERTLDPDKRAQIGAHYTSRDDILVLLEPVVMAPLRRRWDEVKRKCDGLWSKLQAGKAKRDTQNKRRKRINAVLRDFVEELAHVQILDPACGSGNFLYVAINLLLDLEKETIAYARTRDIGLLPQVRPTQLHGIEINPYAQQLAQVVIWIGYLQWKHHNGFQAPRNPILEPIESIRRMDAILDLSDPKKPREPDWPKSDFIVGNPPFLGDKLMRSHLGGEYVESLRQLYDGRVPGGADLCCYWFEQARQRITANAHQRAGLLATQGIRGGANRRVLERIKATGEIFFAESDRPWILDGANVHVSIVGFDDGTEKNRMLDGKPTDTINSNLTAGTDVTKAVRLRQNASKSFLGSCKGGSFDISEDDALRLLQTTGNPNHRPNSDVLRPVFNSQDLIQRSKRRWIIDNAALSLEDACLYEEPHQIVVERVKPCRDQNRDTWLKANWWRPQRMRPEMRIKTEPLDRFLVTTTTSKHRVFVWLAPPDLPDHQLIVFAQSEDYFFGVMHSRVHEVWARAQGTQLRERESGFRYTPTSCFETFPFPEPTDAERDTISEAAKELEHLRANWLDPPEWTRTEVLEFPGSVDGPWKPYLDLETIDPRGIGTVRYPRLAPRDDESAKQLKKRTLTNLYNQRPTWLDLAHHRLDKAVFDAYGWPADLTDDQILERLLAMNLQKAEHQ